MTMLLDLARLGPPQLVDLTPGAPPVLKPPLPKQCWALVPGKNGVRRHNRCDRKSRKGCLTCGHHRKWEAAAATLKVAVCGETTGVSPVTR